MLASAGVVILLYSLLSNLPPPPSSPPFQPSISPTGEKPLETLYFSKQKKGWLSNSVPKLLEEPPVLAWCVPLLQRLLNGLLCIFSLGWLLECVLAYDVFKGLEFQGVSGGHDVVEVDTLDEWLDLWPLGRSLLGHTLGDLGWVSLNPGNESMAKWLLLGTLLLYYSLIGGDGIRDTTDF